MKLFIDTANIDEIKEATKLGLIDGITTNPTLIAREGKEFMQIVKEICEIVDGPISAEVVNRWPYQPGGREHQVKRYGQRSTGLGKNPFQCGC